MLLCGLVREAEQARFAVGRGQDLAAHLHQALFDRRADVHRVPLVVPLVYQGGELVEDLHQAADIAAHHRRELLPEARVVVPLADQLHERVDGDERILDLVGDAGDHPGEELELFGRPLLHRELAPRRQVFEHEHGPERLGAVAHHGIGGHFERQVAQRELHLGARHETSAGQRLEQQIAQGRRQDAQVLAERVAGRHAEDLLRPAVHDHHVLVGPDGDHAVRHAGEDPLVEFLLVLEQVMHADVADRRGEVRAEIEQDLGFPAAIRAPRDSLAERENRDQLPVGDQGDRDDRLQHRHLAHDLPGGGVSGPGMRLVDLHEAPFDGEPERETAVRGQRQGFRDVRGEAAIGADAVLVARLVGEQERAPTRTRHLRHRVQEQVQHAGQVEAGGERLGELLGHLGQGMRRDLDSEEAVAVALGSDPGRPDGAERGHLLQKAELVFRLPKHIL
jgi:hypothetical protein